MKAKTLIISALFLAFVMGGMALMADRATCAGIQTLMAAKVARPQPHWMTRCGRRPNPSMSPSRAKRSLPARRPT